eukprot:s2096_g2.t1
MWPREVSTVSRSCLRLAASFLSCSSSFPCSSPSFSLLLDLMGCCVSKAHEEPVNQVAPKATGTVSEAVATQSKASTALGSSEMDDGEGGEGETKVSTLEADTSDILVQDFHHDVVDEKEPAFLSSCCV